jgi:predicted nuclease with TOPRIM domain
VSLENRLSCPYCGTPIKGSENFCRYCGRLIRGRVTQVAGQEEAPAQLEIPTDVLDQIEIRVHLSEVEGRLKSFKEEVNEMDSLLKNADIPPGDYKERIAKIREETKRSKESKAELEEKLKPFPFEADKVQYRELKDKTDKLEKLRATKQISDEAYKSLSREYQLKKRELENMIMRDNVNIKSWISVLSMERTSVKKQLDILSAKQAVGDLSGEGYVDKKKALEDRLALTEFATELLRKYLS